MTTNSEAESTCNTCGATIPPEAPGALCPACLLRDSQTEAQAAATRGTPSIEQISEVFPELEVIELVGRGGMGAVYRARQIKLDREVALKILLPNLSSDPAFAERFEREARALAKLNHPNIVTVFDFGDREGLFYLLLEYVDGVNLRGAMSTGRFTPEQALAVVPGVCDALQSAHELGVLHRDIKPENILLDRNGKVKIVDFGIARMVGDPASDFTLTEAGAVLGSRNYMAPEQLEQLNEVDHRADIYSLGVVFYEMLTGELPMGRFLPPSEKSPTTEQIDAIVMRTLEKELDRRFQSAGAVKTSIESAASHAAAPLPQEEPAPASAPPQKVPPPTGPTTLRGLVGDISGVTVLTVILLFSAGVFLIAGVALETSVVGGLLAIVGSLCGLIGLTGAWLGLNAIRKKQIPDGGVGLLRILVVMVPALTVGFISVMLSIELPFRGKGLFYYVSLIPLGATALVTLTCAKCSRFAIKRRLARVFPFCLLIPGTVALFTMIVLYDGRYPYAHSHATGTIKFTSTLHLPDQNLLREAAYSAADRFINDYALTVTSDEVHISVVHENIDRDRHALPHVQQFFLRTLDKLPVEALQHVELTTSRDSNRGDERPSAYDRMPFFAIGGALIGLIIALLGTGVGVTTLTISIFVSAAGILLPPLPYSKSMGRIVVGDPPPAETPTRTVPTFRTISGLVRTVVDASIANDHEVLLQCLSEDIPPNKREYNAVILDRKVSSGYRLLSYSEALEPAENSIADAKVEVRLISRQGNSIKTIHFEIMEDESGWKVYNN